MSDTTRLTFDQTLEALGAWEGVPVAVEVLAVEAGDVHSLVHVPVTIVGALELIAIADSDIVPNGRLAEYFVDRHARIAIDQAFFRRASSLGTVIVLQLDGCVLSFERVRDDEATEEPGGPPSLRLVRPPDGSVHSRRGPENGEACVRAPAKY